MSSMRQLAAARGWWKDMVLLRAGLSHEAEPKRKGRST
jgi:hypothetical protein